ncbi:DUF1223 domain-containing protein [Pikeienuella sp. HZG-20]|uniref:DUF1223 domain-containing protein n=1 Tax=Paludibacillus litoralis TaxID=3133267 RepID=UPI0030EB25EC
MRRSAIAAIFAASPLLFAATASFSGDRAETPVVVELFTSQGCSACPPADEELARLAERDDVIALSLHVDYWDYLGWKDAFGSAEHTKRQRAYSEAMHERIIYTPQMVFQGGEHVVGSQHEKVRAAVERQLAHPPAARVTLQRDGDEIQIAIDPTGAAPASDGPEAQVSLAYFTAAEKVRIPRGENSGRNVVYRNVVKGWVELGPWRGRALNLTTRRPADADGAAVLVQAGAGGPILGAGQISLR